MSETEKLSDDVERTRDIVYYRDRGICRHCGQPVAWPGELAHMVPKTERTIARWGESVINHPDNLALTCPGKCNDAMMIGLKGLIAQEHMERIARKILGETDEDNE